MSVLVYAVDHPELTPYRMSDRFRTEIAYFMTVADEAGVPPLGPDEYWVRRDDAKRWYEEGVLALISPLDSQNKTEVEITEEQEDWLQWMIENEIEHVRLQRGP